MILWDRQGFDQDYSVAIGSEGGRGDERYVINSWNSSAAHLEVYVTVVWEVIFSGRGPIHGEDE